MSYHTPFRRRTLAAARDTHHTALKGRSRLKTRHPPTQAGYFMLLPPGANSHHRTQHAAQRSREVVVDVLLAVGASEVLALDEALNALLEVRGLDVELELLHDLLHEQLVRELLA